MSHPFAEPIIRACKRIVSGERVELRNVIAEVAAMEPAMIRSEQENLLLAETLVEAAGVPAGHMRIGLTDLLIRGLKDAGSRAAAVSLLALMPIDELRARGLWTGQSPPTQPVKGCVFSECWRGACGTAVVKDGMCAEHLGRKCRSCGAQATQNCSQTMGALVCGEDGCDKHPHEQTH